MQESQLLDPTSLNRLTVVEHWQMSIRCAKYCSNARHEHYITLYYKGQVLYCVAIQGTKFPIVAVRHVVLFIGLPNNRVKLIEHIHRSHMIIINQHMCCCSKLI
mgnify:CR=1 FL=1